MPLTLITGPANAAKAGAVLERLRASISRDPVLVVPTSADAAHYAREIAGAGLVFGADVTTFPRLIRDIARAAGVRGKPLGRLARDRVVRASIRDVELAVLAASAKSPGFADALGDFFAELQRSLASPGRFGAAVRAWREAGTAPPHAAELAALYSAYHRRLDALGALDADGLARAALEKVREGYSGGPLLLYGFDDLTPAQLDLVEQLVRHTDTDVTVALSYEPGRAALAGSAATVELLKPLAREHVILEPRSEHYAPSARGALHHLERSLFEPEPAVVAPNGAVRLLEAGGERAEAELVGASVLELLRDGMAPEDIAVLVRSNADLFAQVLASYGIPVARDRRTPFAHTRLGTGVLAFARAALGGTANDVVTWLRTPGKLGEEAGAVRPAAGADEPPIAAADDRAARAGTPSADRLEVQVRRHAARTARDARFHWQRLGGRDLTELDALAAAAEEGVAPFLTALLAEAEAIWTAKHVRRADVLDPDAEADARAARELRAATKELIRLGEQDPALAGSPSELLDAIGGIEVRETAPVEDGMPGVLLADPLAIRARRFRGILVCGLQEGELPQRPQPEPFLDDSARFDLAVASGLVLPRHEATLPRERSLFYACVSRPEEALFLSFRSSDEEGGPQQPSPFLDDVRALFTDALWEDRGRRLLAEITWPPAEAPTPHELRRAQAAGGEAPDPAPLQAPSDQQVLTLLAARDRESARGLETFATCPVKWLIEHVLKPDPVDADPLPMQRGSLAHEVLERTLQGLKERTGSARLTPASLADALQELHAAIQALQKASKTTAGKAAARALEVDLERYIRHETATGAGFEPTQLEWSFDDYMLDGVAVSGRVDRVDLRGNQAIVRDYKGRTVYAGARWAEDGRIQAALYALAVREHLGVEIVGALYQPIGTADQRPRGIVREGIPGRYVNGDVTDQATLEERLQDSRAIAAQAAAGLRAGRIAPCPDRCGYQGGCAHPGICRAA
ncbi:PD-(D/E)XK nuclease family protein [Solirubrobacter ginsenosidimutans]|uniref:PD-(D/E)XK nuclease family protein n=1 Tax=Solirubrobacter ginsenosidimutans TaxID=490573 RepID=A0A9X3S2V3_9ACTN|nr:PD-(D/E)XK nuclease family protein [Solirubrobacter ginsenosidimutans]MDA0163919.1 PD-(D/E)XK nuclease family protein [Solirubrobacter ginsenosidimutans]